MFIWDDKSVTEFIKSLELCQYDSTISYWIREFKNKKCFIPENIEILSYDYYTDIKTLTKDKEIFSIGDKVYDSKELKKYGGKKNSYLLTIETIKLIHTYNDKGEIINAVIKINNFYDINNLTH
jgi:hypothetical protein